MAKAMALVVVLLLSSFSVFAVEQLDTTTLPPSPKAAPPPHHHPHSPSPAPVHSPAYPPHHHHHPHPHHHSPSPAPSPVHVHHSPAPTPAPAKPPVHHHHYPPTPAPAPAKPPAVHPPVHAPVHAPVHPPVYPVPRSFVAVQGVVYVKSCKYAGLDTLLGAVPVLGAVVKLQCNNTRYKLVQNANTDKNGYFFIEAPKTITTYGAHKCNVVLVSASYGLKPSNLHGGLTGSVLRPDKPYMSNKLPFFLYTVGPLAFEPKCPH